MIKQKVIEAKVTLNQQAKVTYRTVIVFFLKSYLFLINESSLGLHFNKAYNKESSQKLFEKQQRVAQEYKKMDKMSHLASVLKRDTKEIGELKDKWASSMAQKLSLIISD